MIKNIILPSLISLTIFITPSCVQYEDDTTTTISYMGNGPIREYMAFDSPAKRPHDKKNTKIKVSTENQALYVVEGDRILLATPVTTGYDGASSPYGNFTVRRQVQKYRANTHGWAYNPQTGEYKMCKIGNKPAGWKFTSTAMPYWTEFSNSSFGIHSGFVYPYPKSHGCIRVHHNVMPKLYEMVQPGTPINIARTQPEDYTVGRNMKRPPNPANIPDDPDFETTDKIFTFHKPVQFVSDDTPI